MCDVYDMYNEYGSAPIDSYDLYAMGLRPPRCNGCKYAELKWKLGDKFLSLNRNKWVNVYELDAEPTKGQGEPLEYEGRPIQLHAGFMSIGHSDECYHFQAPSYPYKPEVRHIPGKTWKTKQGAVIPIPELETSHLVNILELLKRYNGIDKIKLAIRKKDDHIYGVIEEAMRRKFDFLPGDDQTVFEFVFPEIKVSFLEKLKCSFRRKQ